MSKTTWTPADGRRDFFMGAVGAALLFALYAVLIYAPLHRHLDAELDAEIAAIRTEAK